MARRTVSVTLKMNVLILISLTVGIGAVTAFLGYSLTRTIGETTRNSLEQEADLVYQALEQLMLPGEAPLVVDYFQGIDTIAPRYQTYLYRTDGTPAFSDSRTIAAVNEQLGMAMFPPRPVGSSDSVAPPFEPNEHFREATELPARQVVFEERTSDTTIVRYYKPLINLPKCTTCHGSDHTIRGVLDLRTDITENQIQQQRAIVSSAGTFLILVAAVGFIMSRYVRRAFITPLQEIGATCEAVTDGDFERRSAVSSNDELGRLGSTVNRMIEGLYERFVLSRYVSSSTLASLADSGPSRSEVLTFLFSDIRGFTSFTERNDPAVVVDTLNRVLNDQTEIITARGGDIDKYVGDEIVAVFGGEDAKDAAVKAALEIQQRFNEDDGMRYNGLYVGIGINTGSVIVGEIGSTSRADFTAVGDNVNIAARLCSGAAPGEVLVSDSTREGITVPHVGVDGPYRMVVKGKSEALRVFKVHEDASAGAASAVAADEDGPEGGSI